MLPVTAHTAISAPREEIFALISDLAYRESWMGGMIAQLRLDHPRSQDVGAAARFRLQAPRYKLWVETQIVESDRPRRIVEATRGGRVNRTRGQIVWELTRQGKSVTRVEVTFWNEPGTIREAILEKLGARRWIRRRLKGSLERLRVIFEEHQDEPLVGATVAGWEPQKAPRFGLHLGSQPKVHTGSGERASSG